MNADILNLSKLLELNRRFLVPLYQRPYVWNEDTHWRPLWEDVDAAAERLLGGDPSPRAHFIGAVVLEQTPKPKGELDKQPSESPTSGILRPGRWCWRAAV